MDFDQLITFLEVARQRSFSRAGEKVFRRNRRSAPRSANWNRNTAIAFWTAPVKPSSSPLRAKSSTSTRLRLKALRDESLVAVADHGQTPRGTLNGRRQRSHLPVRSSRSLWRILPALSDVQISIYRNFTYKIVEKLENGSLDVGVLSLPVQSPSLKVQPIFRDRLMLMVSPRNPLAKMKAAHISEVVKHPLLCPKRVTHAACWISSSANTTRS